MGGKFGTGERRVQPYDKREALTVSEATKMPLATNLALSTVTPLCEVFLDERKILSPFDRRECISLKEATNVAGKSESTMRGWCDEHGLGRRIGGGTWSVSKVALAMFLDGDTKALRAYHAGNRTGELVAAYFRRAGIVP
jgi:hypothetical protein